MECKEQTEAPLNGLGTVLIETLWNVKYSQSIFFIRLLSVLIETLWNVKVNENGRNFLLLPY